MELPNEPVSTGDAATTPADDSRAETERERAEKFRAALIERQRGQRTRLKDYLKRLRDHYRSRDAEARLKRATDTDLMIRYMHGDHYGEHDAQGVWQRHTLSDGDFAYTIPVLVGHVEQAFSQLSKTRVEYEFHPKGASQTSRRQVARMSTELADEEMERLFDEDTRQDEILNTLVSGESPRYLFWGKSGRHVERLVRTIERMTVGGGRECQNCKATVAPGETACPSCGVSYLKDVAGAETTKVSEGGTTEVELGHNCLHVPPPLGVQYDLSARSINKSSFVVERDVLTMKQAEWMYQTLIQTSTGLSDEMRLRRDQERMSTQTDATVGSARQSEGGGAQAAATGNAPVERARHFCRPAEYGDFYLDVAETLPDGTQVKAGRLLGEVFPDGLYFNFVGDTLVEVEPVRLERKWSLVRYGKRAGTNRGTGMQIGIPAQDVIDDSFNLTYSTGMTVGHPLTVVNRKFAKELPDANNMLFYTGDVSAGDVVARLQGSAASSVVDGTAMRVEAALQFILGTQSVGGAVGAPDARAAGTATGIAAMVENASLRMIGPIGQRVAADMELRLQLLENIREFSSPEQVKDLERRYGPDTVSSFKETNFRLDLIQRVIANTDKPRSTALTQSAILALAEMAPNLAEMPGGQELLALFGEATGIPLEIGPGRVDRREAESRLNKLEAIVERLRERQPDFLDTPAEAAIEIYAKLAKFCAPLIQMPGEEENLPAIFLQDHASFKDVYKDALFSEGARVWEEAQRLVVIRLWFDHHEAEIAGTIKMAQLQAEMQQQMAPPPPPEPPVADPGVEAAAAMEMEERGRMASLEDEALKRTADEEAKDAQLERDMARDAHQAGLKGMAAGDDQLPLQ